MEVDIKTSKHTELASHIAAEETVFCRGFNLHADEIRTTKQDHSSQSLLLDGTREGDTEVFLASLTSLVRRRARKSLGRP